MTGMYLVRTLQKNGWVINRIRGSHYIMQKTGMHPVSVPVHGKKDLAPGILRALLKQTELLEG